MTETDAIAIERIRRLFADYCHRVDDGDLDAWSELFVADGVLVVGRREFAGRDVIREWAEGLLGSADRKARHFVTGAVIDVAGATATAVSDYLVIGDDLQVAAAGRYTDRLVEGDDGWRFAERRISFLRPDS